MTFKELVDDAQADISAFVTFTGFTTSNFVRAVSEALNKMQQETKVIEKTITIDATTLDTNGSVALDKSITVPRRGTYQISGSSLSATCRIKPVGRDVMDRIRQNFQIMQMTPQRIFCCVEQNRLYFFPFQGLVGTFTISCIAKMPIYTESQATDATSYWSGWDAAHIDALYESTTVPQEFEDGYKGLVAYVSARLLTYIPGWKRRFQEDYVEYMAKFQTEMENIKENLPDYELNYEPHMDWGGAY